LEHAGFCKNVESYEERENEIYLNPVLTKELQSMVIRGKNLDLKFLI
jgi:hypothetical protein